jgi:NAD-dependent deacetylase
MDTIESIAKDIASSKHVIAFTGAGISAESGISTYRGQGGIWNKYDPAIYANIDYFHRDPSYYWNFFRDVRYPMIKQAQPNAGHRALAELETLGKLRAVITQNIDELHQQSGSTHVIELHGTTRRYYCLKCSQRFDFDTVFEMSGKDIPPPCPECKGMIRPDVIMFGEPLKTDVLRSAFEAAEACDFVLAVGSSLVVYPAADIPARAKRQGAKLAIINKDETPMDPVADYVLREASGSVLPAIIDQLKDSSG